MSDNTAHNEVKPKTENLDDSPISLKVKDQSGEVVFKVKRSTKFQRVFDVFCQKKAWDPTQVRFVFDGTRVQGLQTPHELEMEDGDTIDAVLEQVGGGL